MKTYALNIDHALIKLLQSHTNEWTHQKMGLAKTHHSQFCLMINAGVINLHTYLACNSDDCKAGVNSSFLLMLNF